VIGAAGVGAELMLACFATLLWSFLPDGALKSAVFLIATATWVVSLLVNLNPCMRFDGYYLLADWLGVENLQARGFAMGRWWLRELLFGLGRRAPEIMSARLRASLVLWALATWLYRFFLFVGIAVLIYFLFPKVLGIFLMGAELGLLVARPIFGELRAWWRLRRAIRLNLHSAATGLIVAGLIGLIVVPWQTTVAVPSTLRAPDHALLFPPAPTRVAELPVTRGTRVEAGQIVARLEAPDLDHKIETELRQAELLQRMILRQAASPEALRNIAVLEQELAATLTALEGLFAERDALTVRAPIDGVLTERPENLRVGLWIGERTTLGLIVAGGEPVLEGYVREDDLPSVQPGAAARFYPDDPARPPLDATVVALETVNTGWLPDGYLASTFGGPIAVRTNDMGRLIPEQGHYRVRLLPHDPDLQHPDQIVPGIVRIQGPSRSLADRIWRRVAAVLIRESGF